MKIYAKDIIKKKSYRFRIEDPNTSIRGRATKLAEIEDNLIEFAGEVLLDLDVPSAPELAVGDLNGFEDIHKNLEDVVGHAVVHASFRTDSDVKIRMDLLIPIAKGEFHRPSIAVVGRKKYILSKELINNLVGKASTIRPVPTDPYNQGETQHLPTIQGGPFKSPDSEYEEGVDVFDYEQR